MRSSGYPCRRHGKAAFGLEAGFQYVESETVNIGDVAGANAGREAGAEEASPRRSGRLQRERPQTDPVLDAAAARRRCQDEATPCRARCNLSATGWVRVSFACMGMFKPSH